MEHQERVELDVCSNHAGVPDLDGRGVFTDSDGSTDVFEALAFFELIYKGQVC